MAKITNEQLEYILNYLRQNNIDCYYTRGREVNGEYGTTYVRGVTIEFH